MNNCILIWSKDRALQLDACLRSLYYRSPDSLSMEILVIYKSVRYDNQYEQLKVEHPTVKFIRDGVIIEQTKQIIREHDLIMFCVDDTIFYRNFNIVESFKSIRTFEKSMGLSLRLGENVTYSHIRNKKIEKPQFITNKKSPIMHYLWQEAEQEFTYPLETSSSIYRCEDVLPALSKTKKDGTGPLESAMNQYRHELAVKRPHLSCYHLSVAFSVPVNVVRKTKCPFARKIGYTTDHLAQLFDNGFRINIKKEFANIKGVHQEVEFEFENIHS